MERFSTQPNNQEIFHPDVMKILVKKTIETNNTYSISLQPFIDLYGMETVKKDYALIAERLLKHFDHQLSGPEKMGHIFENAFLDIGSRGHWFGEKSELVRASKFDDIMNGVDMIATIVADDDSARHLAIASDLTFSFPGVSEKFNKILNGVRQGKMAKVKYFNSELLHVTGELRNIPRTVVGLDVENLNTFLLRWIKEPELAQLQYGGIMLNQITAQCRAFAAVAGTKQPLVCDSYNRVADTIDDLLTQEYRGVDIPEDKLATLVTKHSQRLIDEHQ